MNLNSISQFQDLRFLLLTAEGGIDLDYYLESRDKVYGEEAPMKQKLKEDGEAVSALNDLFEDSEGQERQLLEKLIDLVIIDQTIAENPESIAVRKDAETLKGEIQDFLMEMDEVSPGLENVLERFADLLLAREITDSITQTVSEKMIERVVSKIMGELVPVEPVVAQNYVPLEIKLPLSVTAAIPVTEPVDLGLEKFDLEDVSAGDLSTWERVFRAVPNSVLSVLSRLKGWKDEYFAEMERRRGSN